MENTFDEFFLLCPTDEEVVKPKYRKMFHDLITYASDLRFSNVGFNDDQADELMALAKSHCLYLKSVDVSANQITKPLKILVGWAAELHLNMLNLNFNEGIAGIPPT